jgi:hypothetical protein
MCIRVRFVFKHLWSLETIEVIHTNYYLRVSSVNLCVIKNNDKMINPIDTYSLSSVYLTSAK